jgi:mitogen-activated protein kinase kinase kinase
VKEQRRRQYLGYSKSTAQKNLPNRVRYFTEGNIGIILTNYGPLDEGMIRKYTRQILNGLRYLHKHSIAHGDLKTSSLLLDNTGNMKLTDYGVSKHLIGTSKASRKFLSV